MAVQLLNDVVQRAPEVRRWILAGLIVGVPVGFLRVTRDPFGIPKLALLTIGIGLVLALRIAELAQRREDTVVMKKTALPALVLIVCVAVVWLLSDYRGWGLLGSYGRLQGLVPYALVAVFGVLVADAFAGRPHEVARWFMWSASVVGAYAVVQTLGLDPFQWSLGGAPTIAVSTIGNPNFTGGFLGIALPVALTSVLGDSARERTHLWQLLAITAGWLVAQSQGGWAAGLAGCAIVGGFWLAERWRHAPLLGALTAAAIAAAAAGVVLLSIFGVADRITLESSAVRGQWWVAAAGMFADSPIYGRGPDSFAIEGIRHRTVEDAIQFATDFPNDPHSVPMAMLANGGVVLLLGWGFVIGWALWLGLKRTREDPFAVAFVAALVGYIVQSLVSIDEISLRVALWTVIGGIVATTVPRAEPVRPAKAKTAPAAKRRTSRAPQVRSLPVVVVGAVVALALIVWAGTLLAADRRALEGQVHFSAGRIDAGNAALSSAIDTWDWVEYRALLSLELKDAALDEERGDETYFEGAKEVFTSYIERVPIVFSVVNYGRLLDGWAHREGRGGDEAAVAAFERALALDPNDPLVRADLAIALLHLDRSAEALEVLKVNLERMPADVYGSYWAALAAAAAREGELDLAERALEPALVQSPGDELTKEAQDLLEGANSR